VLDGGVLGVRDGHAPADAGGAFGLAFFDGRQRPGPVVDASGPDEQVDEFLEALFLVQTLESGLDDGLVDEVAQSHPSTPRWSRGAGRYVLTASKTPIGRPYPKRFRILGSGRELFKKVFGTAAGRAVH
jgi:hypothetical protein